METVQQNGRFTLFSSKFPSNIYSILFDCKLDLSKLQLFYLVTNLGTQRFLDNELFDKNQPPQVHIFKLS